MHTALIGALFRQTVPSKRGAVLFGCVGGGNAISDGGEPAVSGSDARMPPITVPGHVRLTVSFCRLSFFRTERTEYTYNSIADAYGRYTARM